MANQLATVNWVTNEVGEGYLNSVKLIAKVNRLLDEQFDAKGGAKVGSLINYRIPVRFQPTFGQALQVQPLNDQTVPVALTTQINTAFSYSSAQAALELDEIRTRYITPATDAIASAADRVMYDATYTQIWNTVGVPGTTITTNQTYLNAGAKLDDFSVPRPGRVAVLDSQAMASIAGTQATLFNPASKISGVYNSGMIGNQTLGFEEWFIDQNRSVHTTGSFTASTPLTTTAGQTGSTINSNGWANGATTLRAGDSITFANVFAVNALSYQSTGRLQQFVITADISDTAGAIALPIAPPIIPTGQYQNVSAAPGATAAITVWSANPVGGTLTATPSPVSMLFHPNGLAFVTADLPRDLGGAKVEMTRSKQYGVSIRWASQYQIGNDQNPGRLDLLMGGAVLQSRLVVRAQG